MTDPLRCEKCLFQHFNGNHVIHLGKLWKFNGRRGCQFCGFVLAQLAKTQAPQNSLVFLKPISESPPTYAIVLGDVESKTVEGWISLPPKLTENVGLIGPHNSGNKKLNREQIQRWLHECHSTHHHSRRSDIVSKDLADLVLIDVQNGMLVDAESQWEFAALSYVNGGWGGSDFNLDHFTKDDLKSPGVFFSSTFPLPAAIKDAIDLVRDLGQRYLWCDFLCIFRDNHTQKQAQIRQMDSIYGKAFFTIIALSAKHGNIGLPGVRSNSRDSFCPVVDLDDGRKAVARAPELDTIKSRSVYTQRGWTFQEEVLSQRCIYLTDSQAYFTCPEAYKREDEHQVADSTHLSHSDLFSCFEQGVPSTKSHTEQFFSLYATFLREYNGRQLSYDTDILDAFDGIRKVLSRRFSTKFIYGLPQSQLHHALLWIPTMRLKQRFGVEPEPSVIEDVLEGSLTDFSNEEERSRSMQPPTWSWAAWCGQVGFQVPHEMPFSAVSWIQNFGIWSQRGILPLETSSSLNYRIREILSSLRQGILNREGLLRISHPSKLDAATYLLSLKPKIPESDLCSFVLDLFRSGITLIYEMVHDLLPNPNERANVVASALQNVREEEITETLGRWRSISQNSLMKLDTWTPSPTELMQSWTAIKEESTLTYCGRLIWPFKSWFDDSGEVVSTSLRISECLRRFLDTQISLAGLKLWINLFMKAMRTGSDSLKQFDLTRRVALSFFAYSIPADLLSISEGQLYKPTLKSPGLMNTAGGLACDLETLQFSKLHGTGGEIEHPATAVYVDTGGEPSNIDRGTSEGRVSSSPGRRYLPSSAKPENYAGVFFDYEDIILRRTGSSTYSDCKLLLLSWTPPYHGSGTLRPAMWNMMLVKPVENGFWERVAIGMFREDAMLQIGVNWKCNYIRLG